MNHWVDFEGVKQDIGLAPLLRRYQVSLRRSGRDQYRGRCPIHDGDSQEAFHVNLTRNLFHCFSCGAGGTVIDFVAAMERCTPHQAALQLQNQIQPQPAIPRLAKQLVTRKSTVVPPLGFALRGIDRSHPYLAARGIESCTAETFGVGLYRGDGMFSGRLVIPLHDASGQLVGYCGRALNGAQPRYRFPSGFPKSEILFNLHRVAGEESSVVVVEGFFDCLKLHQAGIRSVVALMGTALYESQQRLLLQRFRTVTVLLDGDAAGRSAAAVIAAKLKPHVGVRVVELPPERQPDQLTSDEIQQRIAHTH